MSLMPVVGAWVSPVHDERRTRIGVIEKVISGQDPQAAIHWVRESTRSIVPICQLRCGLKPEMEVLHLPDRTGQASLGEGTVLRVNSLAGHDRVLVEFPVTGNRVWLPWQRLKMVRSVKHAFSAGKIQGGDAAERFRLKLLAWAISFWNENTGALSTFDIDPLPHQIHLVHHILASGHLNWLIADDVGLGKTIEAGLLLAALRQRGRARRVLLICPAGLTRQWQDEMRHKFAMEDFQIFGTDFWIQEPRQWKLHDYVIASMDRLKTEENLDSILQAERWDLVIFDEAHRLTRRQYGAKYNASQRFDLARHLRARTDAMVLLTATPHQGQADSFGALLELLHPERKPEIDTLALNPEIIGEMVFRNYKADVTDVDGNFVFKGKSTHRIDVPANEEYQSFDDALRNYLHKGYAASADGNKNASRAIGFVMTVYRKLAASSVAAIHKALSRRLDRLRKDAEQSGHWDIDDLDDRYQGEFEEMQSDGGSGQFFEGEIPMLESLIERAASLLPRDAKRTAFIEKIIAPVCAKAEDQKVLIFSEYRTTQEWIADALRERYGPNSVVLLHGGMSLDERRQAIACFEEQARFLVSTEAGGEGINLQNRCHVMVNYDLPWNPMRLVQRVGRLYRYGQQNVVVVFNLHQSDTADEQILDTLYARLDRVTSDLAARFGQEFNEAFRDDVLGELADLVDVEDILNRAPEDGITRTKERIDDAIERARQTAAKQRELFEHAAGFNPSEMNDELPISRAHIGHFFEGMCGILGIAIEERTHRGAVLRVRLPAPLMDAVGIRRSLWEVTTDRAIAARRPDTYHLDTSFWLFTHMLELAVSREFGGHAVWASGLPCDALLAVIARWQDDLGRRSRQELLVFEVTADHVRRNTEDTSEWLCHPAAPVPSASINKDAASFAFGAAENAATVILNQRIAGRLMPEGLQWVAGAKVQN